MRRWTRLRIGHFKPFAAVQEVPLAPITVLYGPNSEGKSAVLEAILALSQSAREDWPHPTLRLRGPWVDLGSWQAVAHRHDVEAPIRLGLFCETQPAAGGTAEPWPWPHTEVGVEWTFRWDPRQRAVDLADLQVYLANPEVPAFRIACQEPHDGWPRWRERQPRLQMWKMPDSDRWLVFEGVRTGRGTPPPGTEIEVEPYFDWRVPTAWVAQAFGPEATPPPAMQAFWDGLARRAVAAWAPYVAVFRHWLDRAATDPEGTRDALEAVLQQWIDQYVPWLEDRSDPDADPESYLDEVEGDQARALEVMRELAEQWSTPEGRRQALAWAQVLQTIARDNGWGVLNVERHQVFCRVEAFTPHWVGTLQGGLGIAMYAHCVLRQWWHLGAEKDCPSPEDPPPLPLRILPPEQVANAVQRLIADNLRHVHPVGPMRHRFGLVAGDPGWPVDHVGLQGEYLPAFLGTRPAVLERVNAVLAAMGVPYTVRVRPVADPEVQGLWKLLLDDQLLGTAVAMDQVGYGLSQLLPLLAEAVADPPHLVVVEQPELHLHPRLQAEVGRILAEGVRQGNQFLVETHSETLLLRLLRGIRRGVLRAEDVSVVYVAKTPEGSQCWPLRVDPAGRLRDPWPGGFFEEAYQELFDEDEGGDAAP